MIPVDGLRYKTVHSITMMAMVLWLELEPAKEIDKRFKGLLRNWVEVRISIILLMAQTL